MIRHWTLSVGLVFCAVANSAWAADAPKVMAEGDWSKPVVDNRGPALRGRLILCEKKGQTVVYVELQDASDAVGEMRLYCDMGRNDFRPEYKGGLQCELRDKDQKPVATKPFAFGGATPKSEWLTLPPDATIRLRATPFGVGQDKARAICPHLGQFWAINDDDPNDYFLSGTFTINAPTDAIERDGGRVWRGTIDLPATRIPSKVRAPQK
jgi:hypothetical protein